MTSEEYGDVYRLGRGRTTQYLLSRGAAPALVPDITQSAWLRGWERLSQLRNPRMIVPWVNSIALNQYRRAIRTECLHQEIRESDHGETYMNLAAIDVSRILWACRPADRQLLEAALTGVTAKEIALEQALTASTVRIRFLRARRSARFALEAPSLDLRKRPYATAAPTGFAERADGIWSLDRLSPDKLSSGCAGRFAPAGPATISGRLGNVPRN